MEFADGRSELGAATITYNNFLGRDSTNFDNGKGRLFAWQVDDLWDGFWAHKTELRLGAEYLPEQDVSKVYVWQSDYSHLFESGIAIQNEIFLHTISINRRTVDVPTIAGGGSGGGASDITQLEVPDSLLGGRTSGTFFPTYNRGTQNWRMTLGGNFVDAIDSDAAGNLIIGFTDGTNNTVLVGGLVATHFSQDWTWTTTEDTADATKEFYIGAEDSGSRTARFVLAVGDQSMPALAAVEVGDRLYIATQDAAINQRLAYGDVSRVASTTAQGLTTYTFELINSTVPSDTSGTWYFERAFPQNNTPMLTTDPDASTDTNALTSRASQTLVARRLLKPLVEGTAGQIIQLSDPATGATIWAAAGSGGGGGASTLSEITVPADLLPANPTGNFFATWNTTTSKWQLIKLGAEVASVTSDLFGNLKIALSSGFQYLEYAGDGRKDRHFVEDLVRLESGQPNDNLRVSIGATEWQIYASDGDPARTMLDLIGAGDELRLGITNSTHESSSYGTVQSVLENTLVMGGGAEDTRYVVRMTDTTIADPPDSSASHRYYLQRLPPAGSGPPGPKGDKGDDGAQGRQGEQGRQGAQGAQGIFVVRLGTEATTSGQADITGNGPPAPDTKWYWDANRDFLTRDAADGPDDNYALWNRGISTVTPLNGQIWLAIAVWNPATEQLGEWSVILAPAQHADTLSGPIGPPGAKGDTGNDGAVGPQGRQGIQGIQGVPGATGPKGDDGADGAGAAVATDAEFNTGTSTTIAASVKQVVDGLAGKFQDAEPLNENNTYAVGDRFIYDGRIFQMRVAGLFRTLLPTWADSTWRSFLFSSSNTGGQVQLITGLGEMLQTDITDGIVSEDKLDTALKAKVNAGGGGGGSSSYKVRTMRFVGWELDSGTARAIDLTRSGGAYVRITMDTPLDDDGIFIRANLLAGDTITIFDKDGNTTTQEIASVSRSSRPASTYWRLTLTLTGDASAAVSLGSSQAQLGWYVERDIPSTDTIVAAAPDSDDPTVAINSWGAHRLVDERGGYIALEQDAADFAYGTDSNAAFTFSITPSTQTMSIRFPTSWLGSRDDNPRRLKFFLDSGGQIRLKNDDYDLRFRISSSAFAVGSAASRVNYNWIDVQPRTGLIKDLDLPDSTTDRGFKISFASGERATGPLQLDSSSDATGEVALTPAAIDAKIAAAPAAPPPVPEVKDVFRNRNWALGQNTGAQWILRSDRSTDLQIGTAQPTPDTGAVAEYHSLSIAILQSDYDRLRQIELYVSHATAVFYALVPALYKSQIDGGTSIIATVSHAGSAHRVLTAQLFKNQTQTGTTSSTTHRLRLEQVEGNLYPGVVRLLLDAG